MSNAAIVAQCGAWAGRLFLSGSLAPGIQAPSTATIHRPTRTISPMDGRPLPSPESLRCFVAAAQQLNFRRAAAEVALTPAALSQRIRQLEELLDCRLFERSPRHVALTPAGAALLERARPALSALASCFDVTTAAPERIRFSLGTRFELGMSWLVPALDELRTTQPSWHIDLVFGSGPEILERLAQARVDAIVTSAPVADVDWEAEVLHPESYVLVGAPDLLARRPLQRPEDAAAHTVLDVDGDLPLARYLVSVCPSLRFADLWRCGTGAAVHALASSGRGVAVLPRYMVRADLEAGRLVELLPEFEPLSDTFRLLYRRSSSLHAVLGQLAEILRARPLT
jgi:DNA-binding transcriptional LysR family regulator